MKRCLLFIVALLTLASVSAQEKYEYNEYYYRRATLFDELPIGKKDIVFLGNSLTDGCEWNELFNNPHMKNRGIISDVVQGLIDRAEPILKGQPKKIFILSGVNDVSHHLTADSIGRVMEKLIVLIKTRCPKTKIYLQSLLPINNDFHRYKNLIGTEQVVLDVNKQYEAIARRQGVTWINLFPAFATPDGKLRPELTNDGLHVMGNGYLVWRDAIKQYVK